MESEEKFTEFPDWEILSGMVVALILWTELHPALEVIQPTALIVPDTFILLLASSKLEVIAPFAFCEVAIPMFSTTNASAAATITNAIITIADSTPMTPRWECRVPFRCNFNVWMNAQKEYILKHVCCKQTILI